MQLNFTLTPIILGFLLLISGCQRLNPSPSTTVQDSTTTITSDSLSQQKSLNEIAVKSLNPEPIKIKLENLPAPYSSDSASKSPQIVPIPSEPTLNVPSGFKINIFADNLQNPRWLALTPTGDILVTETKDNRITLLQDLNNDGIAESQKIFASAENGLDIPFGMAFTQNYFFLGNHNAIRRYSYQSGQQQLQGTGEIIANLPGGGYRQHWTRNVIISPDGDKLYVSIGSRTNADVEELPRASIQVMNLDGSELKTYAFGLRNPVGLAFHPVTKQLYTTVNERDGLGDDLVPDYLTSVQEGGFYGWPFTYLSSKLIDPRHQETNRSLKENTITPDVLFQAHSAALGLVFSNNKSFPPPYHQGAFVAFRGSWNRAQGTGYKIVFVPFNEQGKPLGYYQDFVTGFLLDPTIPKTWGRPVGLLLNRDGSLLFTEEANGRIYRISYQP